MSTQYKITVVNESASAQDFYFFQKPALYSGGKSVYVNSVAHGNLPPARKGVSSQIQFSLLQQYYAGVQTPLASPVVGQAQSGIISQAVIDVAPDAGKPPTSDGTTMVIGPNTVYLTPATQTSGVQQGAFRITTPVFTPAAQEYNIGLSTTNNEGDIVLSNFIQAPPNSHVDVQPVVMFYINTGSYTAGTVVNFTTSSATAAICDATSGQTSFKVTYRPDGTWDVS